MGLRIGGSNSRTRDVLLDARQIAHRLWETFVFWRESLVFFTYDQRQGDGAIDERIRLFRGRGAIPADVSMELLRARGFSLWLAIRLRMVVQGATLLYLSEDGKVLAYGWVRQRRLPRRYRWLTPRGFLLGYFWTDPGVRGRGLYGRLLNAAIAISEDRQTIPMIVYADATNRASIRGLEKAGFARLGTYDVTSSCLGLFCRHRTIQEDATVASVWSGASHGRARPDL